MGIYGKITIRDIWMSADSKNDDLCTSTDVRSDDMWMDTEGRNYDIWASTNVNDKMKISS